MRHLLSPQEAVNDVWLSEHKLLENKRPRHAKIEMPKVEEIYEHDMFAWPPPIWTEGDIQIVFYQSFIAGTTGNWFAIRMLVVLRSPPI